MRDQKLRTFSRELALGIADGLTEAQAAYRATERAKYPLGGSWKPNARKRAQRADVRRWVAEFLRPVDEQAKERIAASKEQTCGRLTDVLMGEPEGPPRYSDVVAAAMGLARINGWMAPEQHDHSLDMNVTDSTRAQALAAFMAKHGKKAMA